MALLIALGSALFVSLLSLLGVLLIDTRDKQKILLLVSFAVGALFGDAFLHIIPEAYADGKELAVSLSVLAGILSFLALEKFLRWRHHHGETSHKQEVHPVGILNLITDFIHNFFDGIAIGVSYLISIPLGIATTIAIALHEIPQELGDYAILINSGMNRRTALLYNFLVSLTALTGTLLAYLINPNLADMESLVLPFVAGSFIYIAGTDLLPMIHEKARKKEVEHFMAIIIGISVMLGLKLFL